VTGELSDGNYEQVAAHAEALILDYFANRFHTPVFSPKISFSRKVRDNSGYLLCGFSLVFDLEEESEDSSHDEDCPARFGGPCLQAGICSQEEIDP